jgi:alkanesulfonate monooxygenase SsuD/methylene tetrahydromethanopterin reductase-like flavin-dependent oxidoreductase (luciferase family)
MTDYGLPLRFGVNLDPSVEQLGEAAELAAAADDDPRLDLLAVQDHPYQPSHLDSWTLVTALAVRTRRISLFTDVADLQLRPPTMLAKAAATLNVLTAGRFQLGVGGGAFPDAIAGMGARRRTAGEAVAFTEESLQIMRRALAGGQVRHVSDQHSVEGYAAGPVPPRPVDLWLGAQGPRMLGVVGRASDGWVSPLNIYVPPEQVPARQRIIDDAARAAGREPSQVRRLYNVIGTIGPAARGEGLAGDAELWADTLAGWTVDLGFDTFVFWPLTAPRQQLETFADDVVPGVLARVAEARGQAAAQR